ncbi:hypothetical protein GCM10027090_27720 [Sinomonas soli]
MFTGMPLPDTASSLHVTMLEMIPEARRRGMSHGTYSLGACELLLQIHAPAGEEVGSRCGDCLERWPCTTVLAILGGLGRSAEPRVRLVGRHSGGPGRPA